MNKCTPVFVWCLRGFLIFWDIRSFVFVWHTKLTSFFYPSYIILVVKGNFSKKLGQQMLVLLIFST